MICARCDQPIHPGDAFTKATNPGASLAGADIYFHKRLCNRPPEVERPRTYSPGSGR